MTISSALSRATFFGNGAQKTFPCAFKVFDEGHVQVFVDGTSKVLTTDYTIVGVGDESFDVVFVVAPGTNTVISVARIVPFIQETDYLDNDEFPAETHERALDLLVMMVQQLSSGNAGLPIRFPPSDPGTLTGLLPAAADRAGKLLAFDINGDVVAATGVDFGVLSTGTANDWTALQTFAGGFRVENDETDPGNEGLGIALARTKNPAAVDDELAPIRMLALNSAGVEVHYSKEFTNIKSVTALATEGERVFQVADGVTGAQTTWMRGRKEGPSLGGKRLMLDADRDTYFEAVSDDQLDLYVAGVLQARVSPQGGFQFGDPTGGAPATAGHLNAEGYQIDGVATPFLSAIQATTSGTSFIFSVPAWAKKITVTLNGVGTDGSDNLLVQLGHSGGFITSGYTSHSNRLNATDVSNNAVSSTAGMIIKLDSVNAIVVMSLVKHGSDSNVWVQSHNGDPNAGGYVMNGGGRVDVAAVVTQLKLLTTGSNSFDVGSVGILAE